MNSLNKKGALSGIRVLDLSRVLAGPWCGMYLGDMGAEVIKVEPPQGDDTRKWGPPFLKSESVYFLGCNRNKKGMVIDFSTKAGKQLLEKLIPKFDVLLENYKLHTLEKWGFDIAWFKKNAPHVVHCSITGYGSKGPQAGLPGYDFILQAESGLMYITGEKNGIPSKYGVAIVDLTTGMMAANSIQSALISRFRTGQGQKVEINLHDTALALLTNVGNSNLATNKESQRYGNGHPTIVPYTTYETADSIVALAVGNDKQFAQLANLLGHPEWLNDQRFQTNSARIKNRELVDKMIGIELIKHPTSSLIKLLMNYGIPVGQVKSIHEALNSDQATANSMVTQIDHPLIGSYPTLGIPVQLSQTPGEIYDAPPMLGQHTREILKDYLGLDTSEIDTLYMENIVK